MSFLQPQRLQPLEALRLLRPLGPRRLLLRMVHQVSYLICRVNKKIPFMFVSTHIFILSLHLDTNINII